MQKKKNNTVNSRALNLLNVLLLMKLTIILTLATSLQVSAKDGNSAGKNVALDIRVIGKVTGANNDPLVGVSVSIKGTSTGTTTDVNGNYAISVPDGNAILVFSYVGYTSQEVTVGSRTTINVSLAGSAGQLDQIVVVGYGTQKKRDLTGSITVVSGEEIARQPTTNPVSALQGKVAGLTIVNNGQAGQAPTVRIRGVNSTNNADPLYVVDGILQTNIDYLNQADIESIEVLKDPSSIAIYGLQGGNGVIIITTRKAKRGETRINFQTNTGFQKLVNKVKVTDASGFKTLYAQQLQNINAAPFDYSNYTANTDWQNQIYRTALFTNNSLSVSNSSEKTTTYFNIGYSNQDGILKYDNFKRYIARLNNEIRITNNIRIGGEINGYYYTSNPPAGGIENNALWAAPIVPIQAGPGLYYAMPSFQRAQVGNPVAVIDNTNRTTLNSGYRVTGNIFAEIKFLKNFTWKSTFYTDLSFNQTRGYTALPYHYINLGEGSIATDTSFNDLARTSVNQIEDNFKTYQQDHTLTFDKTIKGGHHITALAGFSTLYHYHDRLYGSRTDTTLNIPNNPMFWYVSVAQSSNPTSLNTEENTSYQGEDASISYLARVNYSFRNRYLLNATYRRDGTSKFSPSHHWGNFGSIGAGWVLTDESFLQDVSWLNFLKIKGAWGTVGNGLNIGNYLSYPVLLNSGVGIFGNNIYSSVSPQYIPDSNLHWEVVKGTDIGFEGRFLRNRLNVDVDFYDRKTHDILTTITLPATATSPSKDYFTNLGTIDNKGIEITLSWNDHIGKDWRYSLAGNFSVNKNKVESIGNAFNFQIFPNGVNLTQSGYSIGYFYGYKQTGIYQTTAELDKSPHFSTSTPGDIKYADVNGDGQLTTADRTYLGTPFPKYNFGGNISLSYKNIDLNIDAQGVAGNKIYVQRRTATFATVNYEVNRLKAWTGAGTTNVEPILDNTRPNNFLFSSYWLEPGDFLRLRNVQLGYTFNASTLGNSGIKSLRVYISGQNIVTLTKATGYTPEVPINDPIRAGADNGVYPVPAIYTLGINLTF